MPSIPPRREPDRAPPLLGDVSEPIGGLLAMEAGDELALGAAEDYGIDDVVALGEDDGEGPVFGLSFDSANAGDGTGAWELSHLSELVVQETRGEFDITSDARHDASVMEDEFDPDDEVVVAVWAPTLPGAPMRVKARVRRKAAPPVRAEYLPYGVIAGALMLLLGLAFVGVLAVVIVAMVSGPRREVAPLDPERVPKIEIDRKPIEEKTADEILEEVLGEPAKDAPKP
jgi:hypothetical protein